MFGLGFIELLVIAVVGLVFIGPQRLPEVAKQFGKFFVKFRSVTQEARDAMDDVVRQAEREVAVEEAVKVREAISAPKEKLDEIRKKSLEQLDDFHKDLVVEGHEGNPVDHKGPESIE